MLTIVNTFYNLSSKFYTFTLSTICGNIVYTNDERVNFVTLTNNEPKNSAINIRCNDAERAMIEAIRATVRPRVSASKLLIYLCEEKARKEGIITDNDDGTWSIET